MKKRVVSQLAVMAAAAAALGLFLASPEASSLTVEGKKYPSTVTIEGKKLNLAGAGVRKKWFFKVYTMGAYTETKSCNTSSLINKDEVKYLRINMLRDVSAEKMASTLGEAFTNNLPDGASQKLKDQIKKFQSYFKTECKENTVIEIVYVPGKGTTLRINNRQQGAPIEGQDFSKVVWNCYFSSKTCCDGLKSEILESCKKK